MHRRLILAALAAMVLTSCAAETPVASAPVETVTVTATATPTRSATSIDGAEAFLGDVRMNARTLTQELVDDDKLFSLGEAVCGPNDGQVHMLNARVNEGFTYEEIEVISTAGKRHLC